MDLATLWTYTFHQVKILLKAPFFIPEMWWIISPLIVTFLVMTLYFGMYRREELGWNSALGNIIVLLFVSIDLLRTIFQYTTPPSINNYSTHQVLTTIIFIIILEVVLLFYFAFTHKVPKKFMFFIASPLCINIQAYVIVSLVYLELLPTKFTFFAGLLLFFALLGASQLLRIVQYPLMILRHKNKLRQARTLRMEAKKMRTISKKVKQKEARHFKQEASALTKKARAIEHALEQEEKEEFGTLQVAKKLHKRRPKTR